MKPPNQSIADTELNDASMGACTKFQERNHLMWQKKNTCIVILAEKMKITKVRRTYQDEMGQIFSVPDLCRGSAPSPVEQFLKVLIAVCGTVCGAVIISGFVLHLFSRHGVCMYSYQYDDRIRPCVCRPCAARAGTFTFASVKVYFCSFEFGVVGEMIKKNRTVFWKRGSAGSSCQRSNQPITLFKKSMLVLCIVVSCFGAAMAQVPFSITSGSGSCQVVENGNCIQSTNYPNNYANDASCTIMVGKPFKLQVKDFQVESVSSCRWDFLTDMGINAMIDTAATDTAATDILQMKGKMSFYRYFEEQL